MLFKMYQNYKEKEAKMTQKGDCDQKMSSLLKYRVRVDDRISR